MKSFLLITLVIAGICAALVVGFQHNKMPIPPVTFPPVGIACFDEFMSIAKSGYADPELNISPFELHNVSHFRCASKKGFEQYEISGVDNSGHSFYVHHAGGGMAASGADSYLDHCYKKDGVVMKSVKFVGRNGSPQQGSCAFDKDFSVDPESSYDSGLMVATTTLIVKKPRPAGEPHIAVYPAKVEQGDPAMIVVEGLTSTSSIASFTFDKRPLNFFIYDSYVTAFFGADLYQTPGTFPLILTLKDGMQVKGSLVIEPRKRVTEPYTIPDKLGGNTPESIRTLVTTLAAEGKIINALPSAREVMWTEKFRAPLDTPLNGSLVIDDPYGYTRIIGNFSMPHKGTDLVADIGTKVYAMNKGIVRLASTFRNYGNTIVIDHGGGVQTVYMHLSEMGVVEGQPVEKDEVIGLTGDTGYADHPHLHVSVKIWDIAIDPMRFLELL